MSSQVSQLIEVSKDIYKTEELISGTMANFRSGKRISFDANITFPFFTTVLGIGFVCAVGGLGTAIGYKFGQRIYEKISRYLWNIEYHIVIHYIGVRKN